MNFWWETQQTAISTNEGLFSQYQIKPKGKHAFASFFFFFFSGNITNYKMKLGRLEHLD